MSATLIYEYLDGVNALRKSVAGMSRAEHVARPIAGKWSTLEVVCHLADMEGGRVIITSGESGNPWSRHYRDQRDRWWRGELWGLPLSADRVAKLATLVLVPDN